MNCAASKALLTLYVLNDLDEATAATVRTHLDSCSDCRAALQDIDSTLGLLRDALAVPAGAPRHLAVNRRLKALRAHSGGKASVAVTHGNWLTRHHRGLAAAAALVFVLGMIGLILPAVQPAREHARITHHKMAQMAGNLDVSVGVELEDLDEVVSLNADSLLEEASNEGSELTDKEPPEPVETDWHSGESPKPRAFDSVNLVESPVIMRGIVGSRSPGRRGSAGGKGGAGQPLKPGGVDVKPSSGPEEESQIATISGEFKPVVVENGIRVGQTVLANASPLTEGRPPSDPAPEVEGRAFYRYLPKPKPAPADKSAGDANGRVPLSGDIPVAGSLFGHDRDGYVDGPPSAASPEKRERSHGKKDGERSSRGDFVALDASGASSSSNWKEYFKEMGVKWPEGSSVKQVPTIGKLVVGDARWWSADGKDLDGAPRDGTAELQKEMSEVEELRGWTTESFVRNRLRPELAPPPLTVELEALEESLDKAEEDDWEHARLHDIVRNEARSSTEGKHLTTLTERRNQISREIAQINRHLAGDDDDDDDDSVATSSEISLGWDRDGDGLEGLSEYKPPKPPERTKLQDRRKELTISLNAIEAAEHRWQVKQQQAEQRQAAAGKEARRRAEAEAKVRAEREREAAEEAARKQAEVEEEGERLRFTAHGVNPFVAAHEQAFSTFGIDVDTASYTLTRSMMAQGALPPAEAVRTEEFVNAFDYGYVAPSHRTFRIYTELAPSPFGRGHQMLKIGVKGRRLGREEQRPAVLTFLVDTSGSMNAPERIGLVKKALALLVENLAPNDRVAVVQYDSHARLLLDHTPASNKAHILQAIKRMQCSGSTNLEEGMNEAYRLAADAFVGGAENRVLLLSDGVANLGAMAAEDILAKVAAYRKQGIFCSVFGVGSGSYDDTMLETLANKGDGVYTFLDSEEQARRVFVDDLAATLNTIASDVKIQVEFNPMVVSQYRQLGYENRRLKKEDFRNDSVDAGEVGSGQSVTALYELSLLPQRIAKPRVDLPPQKLATVRVRYRRVDTGRIEEIEKAVWPRECVPVLEQSGNGFRLAAAVAEFAEILRGSPYAKGSRYEDVTDLLRPVALELHLDKRVQELLQMVMAAESTPRGQ